MNHQRDDDIRRMQAYYNLRAPEYEAMYGFSNPERRKELDTIEELAQETFKGKTVLEIACGSGYWTELLSGVADSVTAIDTSSAMLNIARARNYPRNNIKFETCDAYNLGALRGNFDAALAGFWLSHIPKRRLRNFFSGLQSQLKPGSPVLFFDNNLVEGLGGIIVTSNDSSDTYKERTVADGSKHVIVKNYFTVEQLRKLLAPYGADITVTMGNWYWLAGSHMKAAE